MARILVGTEWAPDRWPEAAASRHTNERRAGRPRKGRLGWLVTMLRHQIHATCTTDGLGTCVMKLSTGMP